VRMGRLPTAAGQQATLTQSARCTHFVLQLLYVLKCYIPGAGTSGTTQAPSIRTVQAPQTRLEKGNCQPYLC
jgi:hypothetical protein